MPGSHHGERSSDLFGSFLGAPSSSPPQSRRKSLWKSETRTMKQRGSTARQPLSQQQQQQQHQRSHLNHYPGSHPLVHGIAPPAAAPSTLANGHVSHRSSSPFREKKKKENSLLDVLFPKRKSAHAAAAAPPPAITTTVKPLSRAKAAPTPESIARGVEILASIFPKWDTEPLQALLECNDYIMEEAIAAILKMEAADESARICRTADDAAAATADGASPSFPIKNPLPDDFLRLPDDEAELACSDDDDDDCDDDDTERSAAYTNVSVDDDDDDDDEALECKSERVVDDVAGARNDVGDDVDDCGSEKSSTLAEDDGTLYGKEFSVDGDDDDLKERDALPPPVLGGANAKLVADSMNQKFIPVELRSSEPSASAAAAAAAAAAAEPSSIFDTAHIDVIKRSKLNLTEAENRIRHREPHLVFELLSKASEIYRNGVISSHELDLLRSMIVKRIQPSKMLMDMTISMDGIISDHEWHLLILKAKGIRQGLSIRVINEDFRAVRSNSHMEYMIRVVDIESGVVWFTRKRFREFYKLFRKLGRLSGRVNACEFPTRRSGRNASLASDRAPILETFLRTTAALVTPSPLTFLHGVALKQLQQFLDVPHVGLLERNRTQAIPRELRVYVYHTVHDATSPEGKACAKFLAKIKHSGCDAGQNLLEALGDILDGVQEYMLEHRFDEMHTHVQRLLKYFGSADAAATALSGGRSSSFVSLTTADVLSNNDKLQQMISDAIRHELEERVCVPLMRDLSMYLRAKVQHKEAQFRQRVTELRGKPQSYFGIPIDKISLSSWRSVVDALHEIDDAFLPLDKMRKLVATAHAIHTLYKAERQMYRASLPLPRRHSRRHSISFAASAVLPPPASAPTRATDNDTVTSQHSATDDADAIIAALHSEHDDVLSGDDFLPIFIYVIVHSNLAAPIMTQVLLNRLCDPEKRRSESGYYLATFEAALHHILSRDVFDAEQS